MNTPLAKLVLRSAAKYKLTTETKALLIVQSALTCLEAMLPHLGTLKENVRITYRQETLFLRSDNSALASEIHMRRMTLLDEIQRRTPHIRCKFIIVQGIKK